MSQYDPKFDLKINNGSVWHVDSPYQVYIGQWPIFYGPVILTCILKTIWAASSEFVSSTIPSWKILTAHAQPFRGIRDLAFCLKVPLDSLLVWASSGGSGETARMRRFAWTFAARIGDNYQICLTRPIWCMNIIILDYESVWLNVYNCRSLWPIFHGPVILRYILKTIWWMNIYVGALTFAFGILYLSAFIHGTFLVALGHGVEGCLLLYFVLYSVSEYKCDDGDHATKVVVDFVQYRLLLRKKEAYGEL